VKLSGMECKGRTENRPLSRGVEDEEIPVTGEFCWVRKRVQKGFTENKPRVFATDLSKRGKGRGGRKGDYKITKLLDKKKHQSML